MILKKHEKKMEWGWSKLQSDTHHQPTHFTCIMVPSYRVLYNHLNLMVMVIGLIYVLLILIYFL